MSEIIFNGPAEFEMKVFVINDETDQVGRVTIGLGAFDFPTKEKVKDRIAKFEQEEMVGALEGFRLMTKQEAWDMVAEEKAGGRYAMPGGDEWDS